MELVWAKEHYRSVNKMLSDNFTIIRELNCLSVKDVAKLLDVSEQCILSYENKESDIPKPMFIAIMCMLDNYSQVRIELYSISVRLKRYILSGAINDGPEPGFKIARIGTVSELMIKNYEDSNFCTWESIESATDNLLADIIDDSGSDWLSFRWTKTAFNEIIEEIALQRFLKNKKCNYTPNKIVIDEINSAYS